MSPRETRQPVPWLALMLLVLYLTAFANPEMSLSVLMAFSGYLRPREATQLLRDQLIEPQLHGGALTFSSGVWYCTPWKL